MSETKVKGPASYFPSIEAKYGKQIDEWMDVLSAAPADAKHMQLVALLKDEHGMGHGHANALVAHHKGVARRVNFEDFQWITRPHEDGEPARHVAELSEVAGQTWARTNVWRYEPGAFGRRHVHETQDETFVVVRGALTMYLGEPPERVDATPGDVIHAPHGTPLQTANHGEEDLVVYVHGWPPEDVNATLLPSAI